MLRGWTGLQSWGKRKKEKKFHNNYNTTPVGAKIRRNKKEEQDKVTATTERGRGRRSGNKVSRPSMLEFCWRRKRERKELFFEGRKRKESKETKLARKEKMCSDCFLIFSSWMKFVAGVVVAIAVGCFVIFMLNSVHRTSSSSTCCCCCWTTLRLSIRSLLPRDADLLLCSKFFDFFVSGFVLEHFHAGWLAWSMR